MEWFSSVITSPNPSLSGWNLHCKWDATVHAHTRKWEKSPQRFCLRVPKRVFLFSVQRSLSAIYPAPVLTIFETEDVSQFPHVYTSEKFLNFCTGVFHITKTAEMGTVEGSVFLRAVQFKRHTFRWWNHFRGQSTTRWCDLCVCFGGGHMVSV